MKKYMGFFVLLCCACPVFAQKGLLPAAKAAFSKPAVGTVLGQASRQAVVGGVAARLPKVPAVQRSGDVGKNFSRHLSKTADLIKITPGQKFTIPPKPQEHFDVDKIIKKAGVVNEPVLRNANTLKEINQLWAEHERFLDNWMFDNVYRPMEEPTAFAYRNNQIVLQATRRLFAKMKWLENLRGQARNALQTFYGKDVVKELADKLSGEKLILVGENHYVADMQRAVGQLLLALKDQNPHRRVVLFTEFMDLPAGKPRQPAPELETYFRRIRAQDLTPVSEEDVYNPAVNPAGYAKDLFAVLAEEKIEIYPLEDRPLEQLVQQAESHLNGPETSALGLSLRNKAWARTIEVKMAEIRQTDPDALFVVYAGKAHTSWVIPYAVPKFFANAHPAVVELALGDPADLNTLFSVWTDEDPFFKLCEQPTLHYWEGPLAGRLGQAAGFDYMLVLPVQGAFL